MLSSIERYTKVEDSLKEFPEWQEKVKEDIGSFYHLIHNNLAESESKRNIFNKLVHILINKASSIILLMIVQ